MKRTTRYGALTAVALICLLCGLSTGCSPGSWDAPECKVTSKVVSVDSIFYRGGMVTLANGDKINVGQPYTTIIVGTEICIDR